MRQATNISASHKADLNTGYPAVVQKGNVGSKYIYAEQLRKKSKQEIHILRGYAGNVTTPVVTMYDTAGGHTQTWEYSGRSGKWFVGTKPSEDKQSTNNNTNKSNKIKWDKQIARVDIRKIGKTYYSNTQLPRLAYLNRAGDGVKPDGSTYAGSDLKRAEAALSPDYSKFLLATVDNSGNGYFVIYDANVINDALDNVESNTGYVNLDSVPYEESFVVPNFVDTVTSIQGYDIDNDGNIYISSQLAPDTIKKEYHAKNIFKIPTFARTNTSNWLQIDLTNNAGPINIYGQGMHTELEGIQIIDENHCYLTVAYHKTVSGKNETVSNKIYEVSWAE